MRIQQTGDKLTISETPGCVWIFAMMFVIVGGAFAYGALGGFRDLHLRPPVVVLLTLAFGVIAIGVGIWIISRAPITRVVIDRENQIVIWTKFGFFGRSTSVYRFDTISQFCLIEERDDEGAEVWSFGIELINHEFLRIGSVASHFEENERRLVFAANEFAGKQLTAVELATGEETAIDTGEERHDQDL